MRCFLILAVLFISESVAYRGYYKRHWKRPHCDPVKCDVNCKEIKAPNGCPKCECEPLCPDLKCEPPCDFLKLDEEPCPICDCPKIEDEGYDDIDIGKPKCLPPKCPPGCEIAKIFDDPCPGCDCKKEDIVPEIDFRKPRCVPPKCPLGCIVEIEYDGPCPGCKCEEEEEKILEKKKCDLDCLPGCMKVPGEYPGDCPICKCKPICDPPKCGFGCELEIDPKGVCPECICKEDIKDIIEEKKVFDEKFDEELKKEDFCPPVEDCSKPGCLLKEDDEGCKLCECVPVCDPPKCPRRCRIKKVEGKCPECVCHILKFGRKY